MTTCPRCSGQVYTELTIDEERRLLRLDRGPNARKRESQPIHAKKLEKIRAQMRLVE